MTIFCDWCGGFIFPGRRIHSRCQEALDALDVDNDQARVVLFPGEEQAIMVTKHQLDQWRLRMRDEDEL